MKTCQLWGIWNACNGLFGYTVRDKLEDVEALLRADSYGSGIIVPLEVRITQQPNYEDENEENDHIFAWLKAGAVTRKAVTDRGGSLAELDKFEG